MAFRRLLSHFNLGGDRWIGQFAHGFPTPGIISQEGVFHPTNLFLRQSTLNNFRNPPLSGLRKDQNPQDLKMRNRFGVKL